MTKLEEQMSKVLMCDPPSGWKYGFPKPMPEDLPKGESIFPWLLSEGYPQSEIDACGDHFYCRYWEANEEHDGMANDGSSNPIEGFNPIITETKND